MADRYLAVDAGKAETKIAIRNNNDSSITTKAFPTHVIEKTYTDGLETVFGTENSFKIQYDGHFYIVGKMATGDSGVTSINNSKQDFRHKISTLAAIASNVNNGDSVRVAICCPIEEFANKPKREEYLNYIVPKGRVDIVINDVEKHFTITDAMVYPESLGATFECPPEFGKTSVGVIDIGGLNINCCVINKGAIEIDRCFTGKLGRKILNSTLKARLDATFHTEFDNYEIDSFVESGYVPNVREKSSVIIKDVLDNHMQQVIALCQSRGWNLDYMNLIFIGGTSLLLKDRIKEKFPDAVVLDDANYSNAKGALAALCQTHKVMTHK